MKTQIFKVSALSKDDTKDAAVALAQGALAIVPTDTVYGIGTGAFCETAIEKIYDLKKRGASQPLQVLAADSEQARQAAVFTPTAECLTRDFWPGGLTLIVPPSEKGRLLARGFKGIGLRVPASSFLQEILTRMQMPMACTSANLHGQPVLQNEEDILKCFDGKVDFIFLQGTLSATPSSVVDMTGYSPRLLREGTITKQALEKSAGLLFETTGKNV